MNYTTATTDKLANSPSIPEIGRETSELEKTIQQTFERSQELIKRLQPVLSQSQPCPDGDKNPEEPMSDLGATLRRHRRSVDGINQTLTEILNRLAI